MEEQTNSAGLRLAWPWFLTWALASSLWCIGSGWQTGPTFDEPFYLNAGLRCLTGLNHWRLLSQGTMPLPAEVAVLPVMLGRVIHGLPIRLETPEDAIDWLPIARLGALTFWWLLLAAGWWAGTLWGGPKAGPLVVALLAVEPILLGHASLAATDLPLTACLLALVVCYKAGRELSWKRRILAPAVCAALTLLAKASSIVFIPLCLLVVEAEHCCRRAGWARWKESARDLIQIALLTVVLTVGFCPRWVHALAWQISHHGIGHGSVFLLGQTSPTGYWYYFPLTLLIKMSLATLGLILVVALVRPRGLCNGLFLAGLALVAFSPSYRVQTGVRLLLPAVALLIAGLGVALAGWCDACRGQRRRWVLGAAIAGGLSWSIAGGLRAWPQGICFTNELWGGTGNGYLALSDSNFDWGQGLRELAAWQEQHSEAPLDVWYFGSDPLLPHLPMRSVELEQLTSGEDLQDLHQGRYLAVSTTWLYGYRFHTPAAEYLRSQQPCSRTTTFLIYDFTHPTGVVGALRDLRAHLAPKRASKRTGLEP